jgi:Alpha/beta hydrolase domain
VADLLFSGATEEEWLITGEATRYRPTGSYSFDGRWDVEPLETVSYRTRLLVERPPAERFNGIVVVIWNNVSAGFDGMFAGPPTPAMLEDGYAVVGVSAQYVGVHAEHGLVASNPARYGSLNHPGDDYSYDIFTQAVRSLSATGEASGGVLGGLKAQRVVVSGASQSAARVATLHNSLHPAGLIDAYHLPLYFGNGTFLDTAGGEEAMPLKSPNWPMRMLPYGTHLLREDLDVPVFVLNSETEAQLFTTNEQADSDRLVIWENAGASHIGSTTGDRRFGLPEDRCRGSFAPAQRAVWHHLRCWLETGQVPPSQPRLERAPGGGLVRDQHGNALGGIRWPHVEVPLGTHRAGGLRDGRPDLMGSTDSFEPVTVRDLYRTRDEYERSFSSAVAGLVATEVVLPEDAASVNDPLAESLIPYLESSEPQVG